MTTTVPAKPSERWNVHLHAVIELKGTALLSKKLLVGEWQKVLRRRRVAGSADLRSASRVGVVSRHMKPFSPLAYYTTRRQRGRELLGLESDRIAAIVNAYIRLRLKCTFGTWRQRKRTSAAGSRPESGSPSTEPIRDPSQGGR